MDGFLVMVRCGSDDVPVMLCTTHKGAVDFARNLSPTLAEQLAGFAGFQTDSEPVSIIVVPFVNGVPAGEMESVVECQETGWTWPMLKRADEKLKQAAEKRNTLDELRSGVRQIPVGSRMYADQAYWHLAMSIQMVCLAPRTTSERSASPLLRSSREHFDAVQRNLRKACRTDLDADRLEVFLQVMRYVHALDECYHERTPIGVEKFCNAAWLTFTLMLEWMGVAASDAHAILIRESIGAVGGWARSADLFESH